MKKGQNNNYKKPPFQTGIGSKVSYDKLVASVKYWGSAEKKALNICKKKKRNKK